MFAIVRGLISQIFACKMIDLKNKDESAKELVEREYNILCLLGHVNIVKVVDFKWTPMMANLYMEYCNQGSLEDLISSYRRYLSLDLRRIMLIKLIVQSTKPVSLSYGMSSFNSLLP